MLKPGAILCAVLALAACGDPMRDVTRLSDVETAPDGASAGIAAPPEEREGAPGVISEVLEEARAPQERRGGTGGGGFLSGLFGGGAPDPDAPDAAEVAPGTVLPYGRIARVCDINRNQLGTMILNEAGYAVFDTEPQTTDLRTHYITGFSDDCARQFSGTLVMMGNANTHETVRYDPSNADLPYNATDTAFEAIKARVCRVAHGQPCGDRIDRLSRGMLFLTVYETFGGSDDWVEILVHDGRVVALAEKGR